MNIAKIQEILKDEPKFRAKQVYEAVFAKFIEEWDEATNLPAALREKLKAEAPLDIKAEVLEASNGQSAKAAIEVPGGVVETVLMRHDDRNTVCVSSQLGCKLACTFCYTGRHGFVRDLDSYEIIEQVLLFSRLLKKSGERVSNVVFMGMGEPFLNYDEAMKAIRFLNDEDTFNIGARKISVSTVGIIDGIKKFANEPLQLNLAVSLHAPNEGIRNVIMPISKNYPYKSLLKAVADYIKKTNRKVMIEYVLLKHINDSEENALELADALIGELGRLFTVNLVNYNPTGKYKPAEKEDISAFRRVLEREGIEVVQRHKFGGDIKAACGQLARNLEQGQGT
jgi:23S rRNA (adenine2503-C2)-methyltransferase